MWTPKEIQNATLEDFENCGHAGTQNVDFRLVLPRRHLSSENYYER